MDEVFFKRIWCNRLVKPLAHRSQWLRHAQIITTTRIRLTQDLLRRMLKPVQRIRALLALLQHTPSQRMLVLLELIHLRIRVLLVRHQITIHQATVHLRLLLQDQLRHIQLRHIQHHRIVLHLGQLLLHTVHLLTVAHLTAPLRDLVHQVRDLDAKQDVIQDAKQDVIQDAKQDVSQGASQGERGFASISFHI